MRKSKNLIAPKSKIVNLPISKFIDTKYRDYAIYVLTSRGIPSFYDALTPVQRFILMNTSTTFNKSLTVVGKCIQSGYHHGDQSLQKALNKLARPFGNSQQLLNGYGFFGTEVSPNPAATRYTSVKLNSKINSILSKYKYLYTREKDGAWDPFWVDIPIGLLTTIVGIAVGYKTTILPRKFEHIVQYLEDKRKTLKPYFENFNGSISKYKSLNNSWLMTSIIKSENNKIHISEIPPVLKYNVVLRKLDNLLSKYEGKIRIVNNSNTIVDISIIYRGKNLEEWESLKEDVNKIFSIVITENPVFIKDNQVLVYNSIEEYLTDYKWQVLKLRYTNFQYEYNELNSILNFNEIKKLFIEFILKKKRSNKEIDTFLKKYSPDIKQKLEALTSRKFSIDELESIKKFIPEIKKDIKLKQKELTIAKTLFEKAKDTTLERSISSKKRIADLFDTEDVEEINGLTIWNGDDAYDNDEELN